MRHLLILGVSMAVACTATGAPTSTIESISESCVDPPASEIEATSELEMSVEPANASPRGQVTLTVASTGLPDDALAGVDAAWQCWDGARWVTTHIVYRGFGDSAGQTIPVNRNFQIRVPSIGLGLDAPYPIVIPQVDPGIYRIEDEIVVADGTVPGFAVVEVESG